MKIVTIIGARPQFIKAAAVSRIIMNTSDIEEVMVHTGQHYDDNMSNIFFEELEIPKPQYHSNIGSGMHGEQTGRMLEEIEKVLIKEKPDWVLIYGDTNSTLAGALASVKIHVPVAHVEAGLRSFNRTMPEEINRIVSDHVSDLLFAPTEAAVDNLVVEGIDDEKIIFVGDVMYDVALYFAKKAEAETSILHKLKIEPKKYILATIHRAENTDNPERLRAIFDSLIEIGKNHTVVMPLHPRTRKALQEAGLISEVERSIMLVEPVGYLDMIMLEKNSKLIVTDSGGVQKEAFFYKVMCVTLREETEWIELVDLGWNDIVKPTNKIKIVNGIKLALGKEKGADRSPYGEGNSAYKIIETIKTYKKRKS